VRCFLLAILMLMVWVASVHAAVSTKKKHHPTATAQTTAQRVIRKAPAQSAKAVKGKAARTRTHARVRYLAGARLDSAHKAALIEEIGTRLKEPVEKPIAYGSALDGFYAQLASHEAALKDPGPHTDTVRVLQFGDSHTAADMFTGEARRVFQEQFGNGGIGYSYAGHPFAGYRILGSNRSQSTGWKTQGNKFLQLGNGQTGLGGSAFPLSAPGNG
jgi:hypothetical protein